MTSIAIEARITGRVQGVAYRSWTRSRAQAHGLTGSVRNDTSGAVIATFQGAREEVQSMLHELWSGPGAASVNDVQSHPIAPDARKGFRILR